MPRVVALVTDLMDRSRIQSAIGDVAFTSDPAACTDAKIVIMDFSRFGDLVSVARSSGPSARIVAFGPHVDGDAAQRARDDGADIVLTRSVFFRDVADALRP